MGLYACEPCIEKYKLKTEMATCRAPCEICGELANDWDRKFVIFTWEVSRLAKPIKQQLEELRK